MKSAKSSNFEKKIIPIFRINHCIPNQNGKTEKETRVKQNYKLILGIVVILGIYGLGLSDAKWFEARDFRLVETSRALNNIEEMSDLPTEFEGNLRPKGTVNKHVAYKIQGRVIMPESGTTSDLQTAVDSANVGDTVQIPEGDFLFDGSVTIPAGIAIQGAGRERTILRKVGTSTTPMIIFDGSNSEEVRFSGIKLQGTYDQNNPHAGLLLEKDCKNFRVWNCEFEYFTWVGIIVRGYSYGVIWNCDFKDCYMPGYGYGVKADGRLESEGTPHLGDASWSRELGLGGPDAIYIEDCTFSNSRHYVDAGYGGRYVFRYNTITANAPKGGIVHTHGETSAGNRGAKKIEVYENTITCAGQGFVVIPRGADGVVFNNKIIDIPNKQGFVVIPRGADGVVFNNKIIDIPNKQGFCVLIHPCCVNDDCGDYPETDQTTLLYVWGNTVNGESYNEVRQGDPCLDEYSILFVEGRDWFEYPMPGYAPYPYPHPLRFNEPILKRCLKRKHFQIRD